MEDKKSEQKGLGKIDNIMKYAKLLTYLILTLIVLAVGFWMGAGVYPAVKDWLADHNFIEQEKEEVKDDEQRTVLLREESAVIDVVARSKDSVVSVAVSDVTLGQGGVVSESMKIGSGFVVDSEGYVITNSHVVGNLDREYAVITNDRRQFEVEDILVDELNDIALLRLGQCMKQDVAGEELLECENSDLLPLELGESDSLVQGQMVVAIGTPLGEFAGSVTTGVISGLDRSITTRSGSFWGNVKNYENVIQTDASINPGNSGGPLLNSSGQVVGVNFATTAGADNISFALPVNIVKKRLTEYRRHGKFIKPVLGVEIRRIVNEFEAYYYGVMPGALVERVVPDTGADKAGVRRGDIIVEVEGEKVDASLSQLIQGYDVGDEIELKIYRDGEMIDLNATLGEE